MIYIYDIYMIYIIRNMCQSAFFLVYQRLECVDLKEKNRKQMYDQKKEKIQQKKDSRLFLNFV